MTVTRLQSKEAWALARRQHWVVTRRQLLELGFTSHAIVHRLTVGRLHAVHPGVYAVGRPQLSITGRLMAAVLAAGPGALLSHRSAAFHWSMLPEHLGPIHVSVPPGRHREIPGLQLHRRSAAILAAHADEHEGIPVTSPTLTIVDLAARWDPGPLEAVINEADKRDVIDPETLRENLPACRGIKGVKPLRTILDRRTFTLSDSDLERRFRPIARRAGLGPPQTQRRVNGLRVDFYFPEHDPVVETDGLTYHRTAAKQTSDLVRDQAHTAEGTKNLRFSRAQVRFEPDYVEDILRRTRRTIEQRRG